MPQWSVRPSKWAWFHGPESTSSIHLTRSDDKWNRRNVQSSSLLGSPRAKLHVGRVDGVSFAGAVDSAYTKVIHWHRKCLKYLLVNRQGLCSRNESHPLCLCWKINFRDNCFEVCNDTTLPPTPEATQDIQSKGSNPLPGTPDETMGSWGYGCPPPWRTLNPGPSYSWPTKYIGKPTGTDFCQTDVSRQGQASHAPSYQTWLRRQAQPGWPCASQ